MRTLQEILGYRTLTGVIQTLPGGIPADVLPPEFLSLTAPTEQNQGKYRKVSGTRQTARIAHYGSESQRRELKGVSEVPVTLLHTIEHQFHQVHTLLSLQSIESETQQSLGAQEVARQTGVFATLFNNLRIAAVYSAVLTGYIYFDSAGNLLPSSSGAAYTVDYGVSAGHRDQIGGLVDVKWPTASANIPKQLADIMDNSIVTTGYPLAHAFYGKSVLGWLLANDMVKAAIAGNVSWQQAFLQNTIPNGFMGLKWHPANPAFYVDKDGTVQRFMDADHVVLTPEPSREWYEVLEGSYAVPTGLGTVSSDAAASLSQFAKVYGKFSYAKVLDDPPCIKQVAGDTFLPVIKVPDAVYILDVDF